MDGNKSSSTPPTKRLYNLPSLETIQEESRSTKYDQLAQLGRWDDFRNTTAKDKSSETDDSILHRLEYEDVEDPSSTVGYLKNYYNQVTDTELVSYFNDRYDVNEGILLTTKDFTYIRKDNNIYRRRVTNSTALLRPSKLNDMNSTSNEDLSQLGASSHSTLSTSLPTKVKPPPEWENSVYAEIMGGAKSKIKTETETNVNNLGFDYTPNKSTKYIEASSFNKHARKQESNTELNLLSFEAVDKLGEGINELKRASFEKLKEQYKNNLTTFKVSNSQFLISKQVFDFEMKQKPEKDRDNELIASHLSLKSSLADQEIRLKELENKIKEIAQRKSPYCVSDISMPKLGNIETFDADAIKMFPVVGSDEDIPIKDLFDMLSEWAEDIGLSEKALKRAIFGRLRGQRAKAWLSYQKQPLKEAITSLSLLFDKNDNPLKYATEIKNFSKDPNEDIQNSVERLIRAINKYLENRSDHDKKVLRFEYLKEKLDKLLSPRAQGEVFKYIESKRQVGEEVTERELVSLIYKEDMFDQRSEANQSFVKLQNINVESSSQNSNYFEEDVDDLCDRFNESLEINAVEHKRPFSSISNDSRPDSRNFKQIRPNERRMISPVRRQGGSNPIVVGNQGQPLIRVGNPNPNNRWHNKSSHNSNSRLSQNNQQPSDNFRNLYARNAPLQQQQPSDNFRSLYARNAPLQQQNSRPQMRYNRSANFDRRFQSNGYNRRQYQNNGYRSGFNQDRGNLQHNLQFKTDPPAIYQQITFQELNSTCLECPKEVGDHLKIDCPDFKVFRKAPTKEQWT